MSVNATSVTAKTPRLIYIGVFLWALIAACMVIWPNPRVIFPFLGLTLLFLLSIPFRIAFAGLIIFALAHNIGFRNIFVLTIAGRNVAIVEIVLAFVLLLAIIDFIAKRIKIVLSPMLILISIFFISSLLQFIRGIYLGYNPSFIRSVFRSLLFYLLAFPIAIYFGKNAPQKFIKILLAGWAIGIIYFFMTYFGILVPSYPSITARLLWPPIGNGIGFIPFLLLLAISYKGKERIQSLNTLFYWFFLIVSLLALIPNQSRTFTVALGIELISLFPLIIFLQPRGKRLIVTLKLVVVLILCSVLAYSFLRILMGENLNVLIHNILLRIRSFTMLRRDLPLAARIYQNYESIQLLEGNWFFGRGIGIEWHSFVLYGSAVIDSLYCNILVQQGVLGLLIYLSILALWFQRGIYLIINRSKISNTTIRAFVLIQPFIVIGILATGFTLMEFYCNPTNVTFMICCAMTTEEIYRQLRNELRSYSDNL